MNLMHLSIKYNASGAVTHFHDCNETMAIQREYKIRLYSATMTNITAAPVASKRG
jgi:hypothetical protein